MKIFTLTLAFCLLQQVKAKDFIDTIMTKEQQINAGLTKLTPKERAVLNKAYLTHSIKLYQQVNKTPKVQNNKPKKNQGLNILEGAKLLANDGTYLGKITKNNFDAEAITNEFGKYGSEFNAKSINNEFGIYGSEFNAKSPFNEFTTTPPKIIFKDKTWVYLSNNTNLKPRLSTAKLFLWMKGEL